MHINIASKWKNEDEKEEGTSWMRPENRNKNRETDEGNNFFSSI